MHTAHPTEPRALTNLRLLIIRLEGELVRAEAKERQWHDVAAAAESVSESAAALGEWSAALQRATALRHQLQNARELLAKFSPPAAPFLAENGTRLVTSTATAAQPAKL